ncbi:hypothetical protein GHO45_11100 [Pseudomonas sp. FSL R10-0765]|uniref:hypothetical protein n=1 Tax=Pseudomonas sp. FSL R10-0765 TaxID=2662195 RepID=UPI001294DF7C|nr:hypothetical protein [Pseudomonas sp. FSL R10-0765]MQT41471.1 hypothetical protein [Pseudomonas sp. FSL R10-0765]
MDKIYNELSDYEKIRFLNFDVEKRSAQFRHLVYYLTQDGNRVLVNGEPVKIKFPDTNGKNKIPAEVRPDSAGLYALRDLREKAEAIRPPPKQKAQSRIKNRP